MTPMNTHTSLPKQPLTMFVVMAICVALLVACGKRRSISTTSTTRSRASTSAVTGTGTNTTTDAAYVVAASWVTIAVPF